MNFQQTNQTPKNFETREKVETIRELAKRHLLDPSHTTTDEELTNARLEYDLYTLPERKLKMFK